MSGKTSVMVELILAFEKEIDVYQLSDNIGIKCSKCKNYNETKINPITHYRNPAYWCVNTGYIQTLEAERVIEIFVSLISPSIEKIQKVLVEYMGEAQIYIVTKVKDGLTPSIGVSRELMRIALQLDTDIDFDLYVD